MPIASLPPDPGTTSLKSVLLVPLILLALLAGALVGGIKWMQARTVSLNPIFLQTSSGWRKLPPPPGIIETLRVSNVGMIWIESLDRPGLNRWDGARWRHYDFPDSGTAKNSWSEDFVLDGEDVWVSTSAGVLHWNGQNWQAFRDVPLTEGSSIVAGDGQVWVLDRHGNFSHFKEGQWESHQLELAGVTWAATDDDAERGPQLARTADGAVWLAWQGIWRLDGAVWSHVTVGEDTLKDAELIGAAGNRLWLSETDGVRFLARDETSAAYTDEETGLGAPEGVALVGGRTWFAGFNRFVEFDGSVWRQIPLPDAGLLGVSKIAAGSDATLCVVGIQRFASSQMTIRYLILATSLLPIAVLAVVWWILKRLRRRQLQQHQLVTQAVQHATGDVPEELEQGAQMLAKSSVLGAGLATGIGTTVGFLILRHYWPGAPIWTIPVLGIAIHLAITFQQSLVKRKPKPSDPIGPGGPSRYDWSKSWKAAAGALAFVVLINADRIPALAFLRGHILWMVVLLPVGYKVLMVRLMNGATRRGDYDGAIKIIRWFNFYNPSGMEALRMSGHMLLLAGRYREAEQTLRRSLASSHATDTYGLALEYLGDALMEQGRYDEAMRSFEAALHAFPWQHRPYRGMAETLLRQGKNARQALEFVEKILDLSNVSWRQRKLNGKAGDDYWALEAWALAALGMSSEVPQAIEKALETTNKVSSPDMATTHYRAGMAMQALGNVTSANEHFKLAVQYDPQGRRGTLASAALREGSVWGSVRV